MVDAVEAFHPRSNATPAAAYLFLAGSNVQRLVNYQVVDGLAVIEGDIILGPAQTIALQYGAPRSQHGAQTKGAVALANRGHLWPNAVIPYEIDSSVSQLKTEWIRWAVDHVNQTVLKLRPRAAGERDHVVFRDSGPGSGCSSYLGRIGGAQEIEVSGCARGSVVHEILHAAGFYHEQSRGDRDEHVTIMWDEISPSARLNFEKRDARGMDIGGYDYASIMHYSRNAFSRTGRPTIVPKAANAVIGQRDGLSAGDRAAITELYGSMASTAPPAPPPPAPSPRTNPPAPASPAPPPPTPVPQIPGPQTQPSPAQPPPPAPAPAPGPVAQPSGFAGQYTSNRGNVSCSQNGGSVQCQYPGGSMLCIANASQLDCGWSGGGSGRAVFRRQPNGVLAGTWGDFLSSNSRGAWDLVPASGPVASTPAAPPPSTPPSPPAPLPAPQSPAPQSPAPPAAPAPSGAPVPLAGSYASTRGPLTCTETSSTFSCTFQEAGAPGRLDCMKDSAGLSLSCTWATFLPRPGSGRAQFRRTSVSDPNLSGTWGHFGDAVSGGAWNATR
jgi:hypothetical protein